MWDTIQKLEYRVRANIEGAQQELNMRLHHCSVPQAVFYQKQFAPFHCVQYHQLYLSIYETANCP